MKTIRPVSALGCALLSLAALGCSRGQSAAQPPSQLPPEASEASSQALPISLATLPADSEFVASLSLATLRETPVWNELGERILGAFEFSFMHALSQDACGFDPLLELNQLLVAGPSDEPEGTLFAVEGLTRDQLRACVEGLARLSGEQASIHDETSISRYGIGGDGLSVGWLGERTFIALTGNDRSLLERRMAGERGLDASAALATLLAEQGDKSESAWVVAVPRAGTPLARQLEDTGFAPLEVKASLVIQDALALTASARLASAAEAERLHAQLAEAIEVVASLPGEFGALAQRAHVEVHGEHSHMTLELSRDDLELLASQFLGPSSGPAAAIPDAPPQQAEDPDLHLPKAHHVAEYTSDLEGDGPLRATLQTSMGTIRCRLFEDEAPITVANFVGLARGLHPWRHPETGELMNAPLYDGTRFHRVIPEFMIQGGDPLGTGMGGPGYRFANEVSEDLRHDRPGILSMANAGPHTNGSQFFITEAAHPHLDGGYNVFGACDDLDIVRAIARVETDAQGMSRPVADVVLERVIIHRDAP
jgi:peptidyl-prolyl cis-trans isomerase A (cyclophilin A)